MGKERTEWLGVFDLQSEGKVVGELRRRGALTQLEVHASEPIGMGHGHTTIRGRAYTGECLTLVDCLATSNVTRGWDQQDRGYSATFEPGFVAVGNKHFDPELSCIRCISFTATDVDALFHDFHAFGVIHDSKGGLSRLLGELKEERATEVGEQPVIGYFTGKNLIAEVSTIVGKISVHHGLRYNFGGPSGIHLKNRIYITIEPTSPVTFEVAMSTLRDMGLFLSHAAGRGQGLQRIEIQLDDVTETGMPGTILGVSMRSPWRARNKESRSKPHPTDVLLRAIDRPAEFARVLASWFERQDHWRIARWRYLLVLRRGRSFRPDRLISAANAFDLLPKEAVGNESELDPEVARVRDESIAKFRGLPEGPERQRALTALGMIGKPSLTKKVLYRVGLLEPVFGRACPELRWVATWAVKFRNVYVHGDSGDFDIARAEHSMVFLTRALEFIFGASDFLQAGWDAEKWLQAKRPGHHNFSVFLRNYRPELTQLKQAVGKDS